MLWLKWNDNYEHHVCNSKHSRKAMERTPETHKSMSKSSVITIFAYEREEAQHRKRFKELKKEAEKIGYPVVLKLLSPDVIHKTESNAVVLGIRSAEEVKSHAERLLVGSKIPSQLLIQELVLGSEIILGARTDPQFGPFIMVGLGGIYVEILKDTSLRLLPVDAKEARAMLKELKGYPILEGVRGQGRRDISALVRAIVGLSEIFVNYRSYLSDLEINPLIVKKDGSGIAAVDVRMVRK